MKTIKNTLFFMTAMGTYIAEFISIRLPNKYYQYFSNLHLDRCVMAFIFDALVYNSIIVNDIEVK